MYTLILIENICIYMYSNINYCKFVHRKLLLNYRNNYNYIVKKCIISAEN